MFDDAKYNSKMSKTWGISARIVLFRTGRANAAMLDIVKVDVYGQKMPKINGSITTPEPKYKYSSLGFK